MAVVARLLGELHCLPGALPAWRPACLPAGLASQALRPLHLPKLCELFLPGFQPFDSPSGSSGTHPLTQYSHINHPFDSPSQVLGRAPSSNPIISLVLAAWKA